MKALRITLRFTAGYLTILSALKLYGMGKCGNGVIDDVDQLVK
jgi:hypothetical protein